MFGIFYFIRNKEKFEDDSSCPTTLECDFKQTRDVSCKTPDGKIIVDDSSCDQSIKPSDSRFCWEQDEEHENPCHWSAGDAGWSVCVNGMKHMIDPQCPYEGQCFIESEKSQECEDGDNVLEQILNVIDSVSDWGSQDPFATELYKKDDLKNALEVVMKNGIDGMFFYAPDLRTGLINLSSFLAQAYQEAIQYGACDENNWSSDPTIFWGGPGSNVITVSPSNPNSMGFPGSGQIWTDDQYMKTNLDKQMYGSYPLSSSCGQLGQDYVNYDCPDACPRLDPDSDELKDGKWTRDPGIAGITKASWQGAPGPMASGEQMDKSAYNFPPSDTWDELQDQKFNYATKPGSFGQDYAFTWICSDGSVPLCQPSNTPYVYGSGCTWPDQYSPTCPPNTQLLGSGPTGLKYSTPEEVTKAGGGWSWLTKLPKNKCIAKPEVSLQRGTSCSSLNSEDNCTNNTDCQWVKNVPIKGDSPEYNSNCMWWGRGVIQTTGRCNYGKLNKALSKIDKYKNLNLCRNPAEICKNTFPELKWIAGLFYWMSDVQNYNNSEYPFNFKDSIESFSKNPDDSSGPGTFIWNISGIVNRGCPMANCGTGELHAGETRANNFKQYLTSFNIVA